MAAEFVDRLKVLADLDQAVLSSLRLRLELLFEHHSALRFSILREKIICRKCGSIRDFYLQIF
jgi:hypothetical protein